MRRPPFHQEHLPKRRVNKSGRRLTGRFSQQERGRQQQLSEQRYYQKYELSLASWRSILWLFFLPKRRGRRSEWQAQSQWSLSCFSILPSFDSYERDGKTTVNKARAHSLKESNYHCSLSLFSCLKSSQFGLWTANTHRHTDTDTDTDTHTHTHTQNKCSGCWTRYGCWFIFSALGGSGSHEDGAGVGWELTAVSEDRAQSGGTGPHTHKE